MKALLAAILVLSIGIVFGVFIFNVTGLDEGQKTGAIGGKHCKIGLTKVLAQSPLANGTCITPLSILVCLRCGDGICGKGENFCNCSKDWK